MMTSNKMNGVTCSVASATTSSSALPENLPQGMAEQVVCLNDSKAGMDGLDLDKINKIITENSEGSKFYEHKRKRKERLEQKAEEVRQQYEKLSQSAIEESERKVDRIATELRMSRDDSRIIVHVDMDCFFAAVETRDNPELASKPMAVGSNSMLSTSNYIARKFGVRAAMPGFIAKKLCPNLVIVPPDFEKYSAASAVAQEIYRQYDPDCYACMDEASLDITQYVKDNLKEGEDMGAKAEEIVKEIRHRVTVATNGLTCSAGISPVGFVSKICSDMNKPNGQFRLKPSEFKNFLSQLRIRKVGGIGEATETMLRALNIYTCGDIWERRGALNLIFKPATADFLLRVSLGVGKHFFMFSSDSSTSSSDDRKSISCERTFRETGDLDFLTELCRKLSHDLAEDLKSKECKARAVAVKIKTDKFDVKTRIRTIHDYTSDAEVIFKTAMSVYDSLRKEQEEMVLRLFGVRVSTLRFKNQELESSATKGSKKFWQNFMDPRSRFECPICCVAFSTSFSLRKHVNICLEKTEGQPPCKNVTEEEQARTKRDRSVESNAEISQPLSNLQKKIKIVNPSSTISKNADERTSCNENIGVMKVMPINFYFRSQPKDTE